MSLTDLCFNILFDKSDFFNYKTKPFIYFFPNTTFPHIQIINNRPCVPFYSQFLITRIRHAKKILSSNGVFLFRLPDRVVSTIKKYLNNYFVYLFLQSKQQQIIKKKKQEEKKIRRKNFYMEMINKIKSSKLMDKFTSAGSEIEKPESPDSNTVTLSPLPTSKVQELPIPLILRKQQIPNYVSINYDNAQRACYYIKHINRFYRQFAPHNYGRPNLIYLGINLRSYFANRKYYKLLTNILPSFKYFVNIHSIRYDHNDQNYYKNDEFLLNNYCERVKPKFVEDLTSPPLIPTHTFYSFSLSEDDLDDIESFLVNGILKLIK